MKCSAFDRLARLGRDPFALLIVVLAGLGTAHILVRTATYGAAIEVGSTFLLSTALNFLAGEGWRDFMGRPLAGWPPLFPLLLTAGGWVGSEPLAAGRWINATAFGLTILAAGDWLRSNLRSRWLGLVATATIAASLPLSELASYFKTDSLFALFALLALIQLAAFLHRRTDAPLWWAAVFAALAALTRWPGVVLIGTGVLLLGPLARPKHTLVFGAVSSMPLLAVFAHNWAVTATLTGRRTETSGQSLSEGLRQIVEVFREWVVPPNAPEGVAYLLGLAVAAVVLAGATAILCAPRMHRAAPTQGRLGPALPFAVFALVYLGFMVAVVPFTVAQGIDSRYLLPIHVPLLLTAVFLLDRFLSIEAAGWRAAGRYGLVALVLLGTLVHVGCSTHRNLMLTARAYAAGYTAWTYNTAHWQHSETLNYIRDTPLDGRIYSNKPFLAWFADRTAASGKHRKTPRTVPEWTAIEAGAHIVLFDRFRYRSRTNYEDLDLRLLPGVDTVAELADGVVLRVTAVEPFDAERHRTRKQRYVEQLIEQTGERVVRAGWSVYHTGRKLTYLKQPCTPADTQAKFILHVIPADPGVLSSSRQRYGFDNLGFFFDWRGVRRGDQCMAIAHLPAYPIGRIRVGQWISAENRTLWEAEFAGPRIER